MLRRVLLVFVYACAGVGAGCAVSMPSTPTPGRHVILFTSLPAEQARLMQEQADKIVEDIAAALELQPPARRAAIMLFNSKRSYRWYVRSISPTHANTSAVCVVSEKEYLIALPRRRSAAAVLQSLRHELAHYVLAAHYDKLPPWINEGVALFFEFEADCSSRYLRRASRAAGSSREHGGSALSDLVALPEGVRLNSQEYATAWSLVHFLMKTPGCGAAGIKDYVAAVAAGAEQAEQFPRSFGCTPEQMAPSWRAHVLRMRMPD